MLSFKQYLAYLEEALTAKQQVIAQNLMQGTINKLKGRHPAKEITGHLPFDKDDRLTVPLEKAPETEEASHVSPEIEAHLNSKGFTPISPTHAEREMEVTIPANANHPQAGQTIKKKQQQRIGALLSDNKELQDHYVKTQAQKGLSGSMDDYVVKICRGPIDVAGQATHSGLESCKRLPNPDEPAKDHKTGKVIIDPNTGKPKTDMGGSNLRFLPSDYEAGTHVAYLVHKDDHNIENPKARINLVPFIDSAGRRSLHPPVDPSSGQVKQYGQGGPHFAHTVKKWVEENAPMHPDAASAKIDDKVYDDAHLNMEPRSIIFNPNVSAKGIHQVLKGNDHEEIKRLLNHPSVDRSHIEAAHNHPNIKVQQAAIAHPLTTTEEIDDIMNKTSDPRKHEAAMRNPNASEAAVKSGLHHYISEVRVAAAKHKKAKEEDLRNVLAEPNLNPRVKTAVQDRLKVKDITNRVLALRRNREQRPQENA